MEEVNKKSTKKTNSEEIRKKKKKMEKIKLFFLVFLNIIIISSLPIYSKIILKVLPPFTILFFEFLIVYIVLSPITARKEEISWKNFKNNFFPAFLMVVNYIIFILALPTSKAHTAILIFSSIPILIAFYFLVTQKKKFSSEQKMGLIIGFVGLFLIVFEVLTKMNTSRIVNNFWIITKSNVLILLSAVFFTLYLIFYKQKENKKSVSIFSVIYYASIIGCIISFFPMVFVDFENKKFIYQINFQYAEIILWISIVCIFISNLIQKYITKNYNETINSLIIYFQPIIGLILSYFILGEIITFISLLGMFFIILGAKTISKILNEQKKTTKKTKNLNSNEQKKNEEKVSEVRNIGNVQSGDILKVQVISETKK